MKPHSKSNGVILLRPRLRGKQFTREAVLPLVRGLLDCKSTKRVYYLGNRQDSVPAWFRELVIWSPYSEAAYLRGELVLYIVTRLVDPSITLISHFDAFGIMRLATRSACLWHPQNMGNTCLIHKQSFLTCQRKSRVHYKTDNYQPWARLFMCAHRGGPLGP